jgi:hypothetical protein
MAATMAARAEGDQDQPAPAPAQAEHLAERLAPLVTRALALTTLALGAAYLVWRVETLVGAPGGLPLLVLAAETYLFGLVALFAVLAWHATPPRWPASSVPDAPVAIFVLDRDEPPPLLAATLRACARLRYPHTIHVLDFAAAPAHEALARAYGCHYLAAGAAEPEEGRLLARALREAGGDYALVLAAGQLPQPELLAQGLGAFMDARVAWVQCARETRTFTGEAIPRNGLAALVLRARAGWGLPPLEGTVLLARRTALLALGTALARREEARQTRRLLATVEGLIRRAAREATVAHIISLDGALNDLGAALRAVRRGLRQGLPLECALQPLEACLTECEARLAGIDLAALRYELAAEDDGELAGLVCGSPERPVFRLGLVRLSPLAALGAARLLAGRLAEAHGLLAAHAPVPLAHPEATRALHALGWRGRVLTAPLVTKLVEHAPGGLEWSSGRAAGYLAGAGWACGVLVAAPVVGLAFGVTLVPAALPALLAHLLPYLLSLAALVTATGAGAGLGNLWPELRLLAAAFPQGFAASLPHRRAHSPTAVSGERARVRWPLVLVWMLALAVVLGGLRLSLGLVADPPAVLAQAALALGEAWVLWAGVNPRHEPDLRRASIRTQMMLSP